MYSLGQQHLAVLFIKLSSLYMEVSLVQRVLIRGVNPPLLTCWILGQP